MHSKIRGYDRAFKLESYHTVSFGMDVGTQKLKIPPFAGSISTLPFAPLEMPMREAEIREELMKRAHPQIKSRVMIDGTSYNRICPDYSWEAAPEAKTSEDKTAEELTDEELLPATNVLRGFSFSEKKWFQFFIDNYSEICLE
ncbi:hypothetical protein DFH08DRAFT_965240 [Mycena albidolilacea]|uniref:Uncharacterized protein n=1 Tax=Mycena albidolilacea TaxID=1033008 RepID=A0AAD7ELQ0_9AGAR|nr:hypothetical protein DFH08DRAFT_965240 [Mycena albidolilacea]